MTDASEAARWGVEPGYHDMLGGWHTPTPLALQELTAVLRAGRSEPVAMPSGKPAVAWQCGDRRMWGLSVPLYALRSAQNWGHGDFGDLARLIETVSALGCGAVGLNPLHALFPDRPEDASPYSPNSRLFLNPLYIDLDAVDEFPGLAALGLEADVAALRATDIVAYKRVAEAKLAALRACHARFGNAPDARQRDFDAFRRGQGGDLVRFAAFEVLRQRFAGRPWREWPEPWRSPDDARLGRFCAEHADAAGFQMYVQWLADSQLQACQQLARRRGMPIGLGVDLAVGADPAGADAWAGQGDMLIGVSVGAPPDQFNPAGQDWGLTSFNPHALAASDFEPLRRLLRATMRHAGSLRIDHVLGLMRLYLIPRSGGAAEGAYVRFPLEGMLTAVAEESAKARCVVIGEDLGTVPDGLREALARRGLWRYLVLLFERERDGAFRAPDRYPANALVTFTTHDLPTFGGWMSGKDMILKRSVGVDPGESDEARAQSHAALRAALAAHGPGNDFPAVAHYLARTPARLVMVALEDVLGIVDQINIPGTFDQYPNWRNRMPLSLEALKANRTLNLVAEIFSQAGRASST
ncbi:MAG: 4-alpha-glucanotransferase [Xanthobacteraceae bacterium]|nr:4-alpha-glucanotransferase [Xanthobacteraceae bacterium]